MTLVLHAIPIDGTEMSSGVYFYRVTGTVGGHRTANAGKLVLVR